MANMRRTGNEEYSPQDWADLNERVWLLATAAQHSGNDHPATEALIAVFRPRIVNLARLMPVSERKDVVDRLFFTTFQALRSAVRNRADDIVAYTFAAIRHEFVRVCTELAALDRLTHDGDTEQESVGAQTPFEDALARVALSAFRKNMVSTGRRMDALVGDVVVANYLFGGSMRSTCITLGLTTQQVDRVCQEISRQRRIPTSALHRFGDALFPRSTQD